MSFRLIQLSIPKDWSDDVDKVCDDLDVEKWWRTRSADDDDPVQYFLTLHNSAAQDVLDRFKDALSDCDDWQLISHKTQAVLPEPKDEEKQEELDQRNESAAREEIYADVRNSSVLTLDYLIMTALATFVAAIGLNTGQIAVVIGAMVIAPLLGPIIAFSFATALGNRSLLGIALRALAAGIAVAAVIGGVIGMAFPINLDSSLMDFAGPLGLNTIALPLASGAAAALMVAQGKTSTLVGVMVAAALLPPLAAFGLLLGASEYQQALIALITVVTNIIAINLAAQIVFLTKGVRPMRWLSDKYDNSLYWNVGISVLLIVGLIVAIYLFGGGGAVSWDG
ncbi:TIGR00341 family protein [Pseudaestuariivita rosea]|uniref:TIGR00341 family protein n=1 Tax=Pseudaestuariivita rosea TaxID=2763263 RepID=UPI001ABA9A99|nr:TIGR00341 family protein [Pseudaestuariivita rosea]